MIYVLLMKYHASIDTSTVFSVMLLDIDNFKIINDTYGHTFGDIVLQELVKRVQDTLRDTDVLARYGGEEFCCILPETNLKGGKYVAERIRTIIADTPFSHDMHTTHVTVSIGLAQMDTQITTATALLDMADTALLKAKRAGKKQMYLAFFHFIRYLINVFFRSIVHNNHF